MRFGLYMFSSQEITVLLWYVLSWTFSYAYQYLVLLKVKNGIDSYNP